MKKYMIFSLLITAQASFAVVIHSPFQDEYKEKGAGAMKYDGRSLEDVKYRTGWRWGKYAAKWPKQKDKQWTTTRAVSRRSFAQRARQSLQPQPRKKATAPKK